MGASVTRRALRPYLLTVYRDEWFAWYTSSHRTVADCYTAVDALESVTACNAIDLTGPDGLRRRWTRDPETGSMTASAW